LSLAHDTIAGHIHTNYYLMKHGNVDLTALNEMIPWEREAYYNLFLKEMEAMKESGQ